MLGSSCDIMNIAFKEIYVLHVSEPCSIFTCLRDITDKSYFTIDKRYNITSWEVVEPIQNNTILCAQNQILVWFIALYFNWMNPSDLERFTNQTWFYLKVKIMQFNCAGFNVSQTRSSRTSWKKKKVFVKSSSLSTFGVWGYNFGEKSEDFFITSCWVCVAKVVSIEEVKHASLAPSYLLKKVITVLKFWVWAIIFHVINNPKVLTSVHLHQLQRILT